MKYIDLQEGFLLEIDQLDTVITRPNTSDMEYWFNQALLKYVETRYSGMNYKRTGFEQDQKRTDDLRKLVTTQNYLPTAVGNTYTITIPTNYLHTLGETAYIYSNNTCWEKVNDTPVIKSFDVTECTIENIDAKRNNSFSEHRLHNNTARPLRLYRGNNIILETDGNYYINNYLLTYLRLPNKLSLVSAPFDEYTELPEHCQRELIKLAAQMYIENKGNPRYETYSNEVNTME